MLQSRSRMLRILPQNFSCFSRLLMTKTEAMKVLNVSEDNSKLIRKTYLNDVKKFHPDAKDGDKQKFLEISEAYQVLSEKSDKDPEIEDLLKKYRNIQVRVYNCMILLISEILSIHIFYSAMQISKLN